MRSLPFLFLTLSLFLFAGQTHSQTFTKVTDPSNPIVGDHYNSGGGSWADFNNDGYLDLFVANGNDSSQNNSLYLNDRHGSFIKVFNGPLVHDGGTSIGGTWGDYNNDGSLDLFVTNRLFSTPFGNFFYQGAGDTAFAKITTGGPAKDAANSNSSSWVDVDGDGNLDLFVVNFQGNNFLYYNSGPPSYTFTRVDTGSIVNDGGAFSIVGAWADYNNDGRPDLFLGNAGSQNDLLFTNNGGGKFTKSTFADGKSTLGASWGDYDNDGNLDLFVANYSDQTNILYHNSGPPNYTLTPVDTGIVSNDAGNHVGSVWGDFNNDGNLDLFVCNDGGNNALYLNSGPPAYGFTKVTTGIIVNDPGTSFGCAAADFDNNGSLDLFVANHLGGHNFLYLNNGNSNNWVNIRCVGTTVNRSAIGVKVRIRAAINGTPRWQTQEVMAQTGYNSQDLWLHFGLGDAGMIDSVRIDWRPGVTENYVNQPIDRLITFTEGSGPTSVAVSHALSPTGYKVFQNYPNPFNPTTTISYELPARSFVTLKVYDLLGREAGTLVNEVQEPGEHTIDWHGGLASGVYIYRIEAASVSDPTKQFMQTRKMELLR